MSGDPPIIGLPDQSTRLLEAIRAVLATGGLPPVVLIGGLAVTMRTSAMGSAHRATVDIDLVTNDASPTAEEVLAAAHDPTRQLTVITDVKVDFIATASLTDDDLNGLEDRDRLFLSGHRWAYETGQRTRLVTASSDVLEVSVATTAGLVACKSHAIGYPTTRRRATKHAADLLDLLRLVELYNPRGALSDQLREGPTELARIVADIAESEILSNVARAARQMAGVTPTPVHPDDVNDIIGDFVGELRS